VTELFVHDVKLIHRLTYKEGLTIETTWNHPFWVQDKGWTEAKDLHAGERSVTARSILKGKQPKLQTVSFTSNVQPGYDDPSMLTWDDAREGTLAVARVEEVHRADKVYNIEVEGNHTYFVTEEGVLVHNYEVKKGDSWQKVMKEVGLNPDNAADREKFMSMKITKGCPGGKASCTVADQYRGTAQPNGVWWFATGQEVDDASKVTTSEAASVDDYDGWTRVSNDPSGSRWTLSGLYDSAVSAVGSLFRGTDRVSGPVVGPQQLPNGEYLPAAGYPVTSRVGPRVPIDTDGDGVADTPPYHHGTDIGTPANVPLGAAEPGEVIGTPVSDGGGRMVIIRGDDGKVTTYMHLNSQTVREGQEVARGELIGTTGNTGSWTTGPHLHYQVQKPDRNGVLQFYDPNTQQFFDINTLEFYPP
jgi:murein DD-endopeptidase MepM/ murein hydrolase activator NlpD